MTAIAPAYGTSVNGGTRIFGAPRLIFAADIAIGFAARVSRSWVLQGRAALGGGTGDTDFGWEPLLDTGVDLSARVGAARFYFGFGGFGRLWRIYQRRSEFEYGGGALLEIGWLLGDNRQLDLNMRLQGGPYKARDRSQPEPLVGTTFSVGWRF